MTLIGSQSMREPSPMSDQIAEHDIVRTNGFGQRVVVVPKGQRIPEEYLDDEPQAKRVDEPAQDKQLSAAPSDKARGRPRRVV